MKRVKKELHIDSLSRSLKFSFLFPMQKKILDLICFVLGPVVLIVSIFSFDHKGLIGMSGSSPIYYPVEALAGIGIGAAFICMGFLRRYWRKNEIANK